MPSACPNNNRPSFCSTMQVLMSGNAESWAARLRPAGPQPTIRTSTSAGTGPGAPEGRTRSAGSAISGSPGSNPFRWNCIEICPVDEDRRAPLMAHLRRPTQRAQVTQNGRLREIVAQEDVDVDPLLIGHDGIAQAVGKQDTRRGARLVARVLVDDRVDHAAEEKGARMHCELVGDPDDVMGAA